MVDRLILGMVVLAAFLFIPVVVILARTLWYTRDLPGLGKAILLKLVSGDIWMIGFLGYIMANRIWEISDRLNDGVLIGLAVILVCRPMFFLLWYARWERAIKREKF